MADTHPVADSQTYSSADLHAVAYVYPIPDTDLYTVSDVHAVAGSQSRADVHAIPDLYPTHTRPKFQIQIQPNSRLTQTVRIAASRRTVRKNAAASQKMAVKQ